MTQSTKTGNASKLLRVKQFYHYPIFWIGIVLLLGAMKILLPKIPIFRGWGQKFIVATVDIAKQEIPNEALRVSSSHEVIEKFLELKLAPAMIEVGGPLLLAAWKCKPVNVEGACLRYIWQGSNVTLVITRKVPPKVKDTGPFRRKGFGGFFIADPQISLALTGPFEPEELKNAWTYARGRQ